MKSKILIIILLGLGVMSFTPKKVQACEIDMTIVKGKKEVYQKGDTIVVLVKVSLTHRTCPVGLKETKFKLSGMKVLKSTPWKQRSANVWERKLMIVVTDVSKEKLVLTAVRECDKDGGFGTLKLKAKK